MEAIDFARLRQQERQKARQRRLEKQAEGSSSNQQQEATTNQEAVVESCAPPWTFPPLSARNIQVLHPSKHVLSRQPASVYYIPDLLSAHDFDNLETALVSWLQALPEATTTTTNNSDTAYRQALGKWTRLRYAARRVALFDGRIQAFPEPLHSLVQLLQTNVWERVPNARAPKGAVNHILINEYTETQGIMGHTDGPIYDPCTLTLSLASEAVLHFEPSQSDNDNDDMTQQRPSGQVWLQANSLVVFTQDLYQNYQHSIRDEKTVEHLTESAWNGTVGQAVRRGPLRYSLTFRCKRGQQERAAAAQE